MASDFKWIPIADFTGGRNAVDDPLSLRENQVVEMRNGDTFRTRLFRKRGGAAAPAIGAVFTGVISSLIAHLPGNNPAAAELWGADDATPPVIGRMAAASTFSAPTLKDNPSNGAGPNVRGASYGGKLFLAYDTAVDRMHVYDPTLAAPSVRRMGLATPAAPTVADSGSAGTYAATLRYYRQRYRIKNGTLVVAQSEPSASQNFTPVGTKLSAVVTKAASISESETHWVIEGSEDNVAFYELAEVVVGTTTYDDTETRDSYSENALSPIAGAYTAPTSWKYVIAAFNRVFGLGSWETGGLQSRLFYTPAKGAADKGDDERVPNTLPIRNFLDFGEGTGGDGTGFAGPIYGSVYLFKYSAIRKITPTGASSPVFDTVELSDTAGAIEQECICLGEDANSQPAIFFLDSQLGPMITGPVPPTEIGQGVRDWWDLVNLAATIKAGYVRDYRAKGQVLFGWATGANNEPNILAIYTKQTGGWQVFDTGGKIRLSRAVVMFARTLGATMSRDKVPYHAYSGANNTLLRGDTTDTSDSTTAFQGLVKTRPYAWNGGRAFRTATPWIVAKPAAGVTLTISVDQDFGLKVSDSTIDLTPTVDEVGATRIFRRCGGLDVANAHVVQYQIADAAAAANAWTIERLWVPVMALDEAP